MGALSIESVFWEFSCCAWVHLVVFLRGWECLLVSTLPNCDDKELIWASCYEIVWGRSRCSDKGLWIVCLWSHIKDHDSPISWNLEWSNQSHVSQILN